MDIEFRTDLPAVILRPRGPMNVANFHLWGEELRAHPRYDPELHQIVDLTQVDFGDLRRPAIDRMVAMAATLDYGPRTLIALVASEQLSFGLSRMYELVASGDVPRNRAVFHDLDEALAWVREESRQNLP